MRVSPAGTARHDWIADAIVAAPVVVTTLFAKFAVPAVSQLGLGFGFPLLVGALLVGIVLGRVGIDLGRATYFALMIAFIGIVQVAREEPFSISSLIFMSVVSGTYILIVPRTEKGTEDAMRFFGNFALFIAVCGIAQFFLQFGIGNRYAFPIDNLVPKGFIIQGFHNLNPLGYLSTVYKSNGVFLQEPSFFSQLIAVAIVVELATSMRWLRLAILGLASIVSYSGTGLLILAVCIPIVLIFNRRLDVLGMVIGLVVFAAIFAVPLKLDVILTRLGEFNSPRSSAFQRFVSWYFLIRDTTFSNPWRALFGFGVGSFREVSAGAVYIVAEMFHAKLLVELGIVGTLVYVGFLMYCTFTSDAPIVVRIAVATLYFMNGAYADSVSGIALSLLLLTPRRPKPKVNHSPGSRRTGFGVVASARPPPSRGDGI